MYSIAEHNYLLSYELMQGWGYTERGERDADSLAQLAAATLEERERGVISLDKLSGGGRGGLVWPGPPQLPVHRSQWKFIFPIGHISFIKRLDSMLKLIRNYINPIGLTVYGSSLCRIAGLYGYSPERGWLTTRFI